MFNISIFFNPDNKEKLQENKARLRKIAAGEYTELPEISTFRCSSIEDIYRRNNLGNFFRRIFNSDEYLRLDNLFSGLGNYDHEFCGLLRELGHMIQVDATGTLNFVKTGDYEAANRKLDADAEKYQSIRTDISEHLKKLRELQNAIRKGVQI